MVDAAKATERRVRAQQAKDFLISQIVEEAERENVPLSEVEGKMLSALVTREASSRGRQKCEEPATGQEQARDNTASA